MNDLTREEHQDLREQLGVFALGHGSPVERAAVQAHLDGCASCQAELAALTPLAALLADVDPDRLDETPVPPPGLRDAVLARIAAEPRPPVRLADQRRRRLATAAAAVAIAAAAFALGWLVRPQPPQGPLEPVAVQTADADIRATAAVVPHTWGVEVKLTGTGFTAGEVYSVTVREADGDQVSAGEFIGVGPAEMICNLNSSVLRADAAGFVVVDSGGTVVVSSTF